MSESRCSKPEIKRGEIANIYYIRDASVNHIADWRAMPPSWPRIYPSMDAKDARVPPCLSVGGCRSIPSKGPGPSVKRHQTPPNADALRVLSDDVMAIRGQGISEIVAKRCDEEAKAAVYLRWGANRTRNSLPGVVSVRILLQWTGLWRRV